MIVSAERFHCDNCYRSHEALHGLVGSLVFLGDVHFTVSDAGDVVQPQNWGFGPIGETCFLSEISLCAKKKKKFPCSVNCKYSVFNRVKIPAFQEQAHFRPIVWIEHACPIAWWCKYSQKSIPNLH